MGPDHNSHVYPIEVIQISAPPQGPQTLPADSGRNLFKIGVEMATKLSQDFCVWVMRGISKKKDASLMAGSISSASSDSLAQMPQIDENDIYSTSHNSVHIPQIAMPARPGEGNASFTCFKPILRAIRASMITAAKLSRDFYLWAMRRNNRQVRYHPQIDHLLFQESMFLKLTPPVVTAFITIIIASDNPSYSLTDPSFQALVYRFLKFTSGSFLSLIVGELHKLTIPELAVFSMIASKCLLYTSFIIVILELLFNTTCERLVVYLVVVLLLIALVNVVVTIIRYDVREPEG